jgi:hypothetical protein
LGSATSGAREQESHRREMIVLEERAEPGGEPPQAGRPRPADLAYKWCPPTPVFCRQVALPFLSLCAQVFVPRATIDIAILPKLDSSNNSHP